MGEWEGDGSGVLICKMFVFKLKKKKKRGTIYSGLDLPYSMVCHLLEPCSDA